MNDTKLDPNEHELVTPLIIKNQFGTFRTIFLTPSVETFWAYFTLAKTELLQPKNAGAQVAMDFK